MIILFLFFLIFSCFGQDPFIFHNLTTKTLYWQQGFPPYSPIPANCENQPIFFNLVARHGSRLPSKGNIKQMVAFYEKLQKYKYLINKTEFPWFENWVVKYNPIYAENLDFIGQQEHYNLSLRYKSLYPKTLQREYSPQAYEIQTTQVSRTGRSGESFSYALFKDTGGLPELFNPWYQWSLTKSADNILRFFQSCTKYVTEVKENPDSNSQADKFKTLPHVSSIGNRIADLLGVSQNWTLTFDDIDTMYLICAYQVAIEDIKDEFCSLFNSSEVATLEYFYDLQDYWIKGYGYPLNYDIACPLYNDFINQFDNFISGKSITTAKLRFGHAETIIPFAALLGLFKDDFQLKYDSPQSDINNRKWRTNIISPFAANILISLYNCTDGYKVQLFVNEKEYQIPGCSNMFCPYNEFRQIYKKFETCDWDKMCYSNPEPSKNSEGLSIPTTIGIAIGSFFIGLIIPSIIFFIKLRKNDKI